MDCTFEQISEQDVDYRGSDSGGATIEYIKKIDDHLPQPDEPVIISKSLLKEMH